MALLLLPVALVLASPASAAFSADQVVTLTPWCDSSMRVRVAPGSLPPAAAVAAASLSKSLAAKV